MKLSYSLLVIILSGATFFLSAQSALKNYNFSSPVKQFNLDNALNEISGLALSSGKLFTHNDEAAVIYQLNYKDGKILKKFSAGNGIKGDFEGIAAANNKLYIITSTGDIYSFSEQKEGGNSEYKMYSTGISNSDIEGLCYDGSTNSLLIACKEGSGKKNKGLKAVYSFNLGNNRIDDSPRFLISPKEIEKKYGIKKFSPSSIEKNPKTGTFFILSSNDMAVIELSASGKIIAAVKLNKDKHRQPEGLTFAPDGSLLISDEGKNGTATVTIYALKK